MLSPHMLQIKASAGSGKTYTITKLFLDFLANTSAEPHKGGCRLHEDIQSSWGDIMAITFTNAAAAEMKERVLVALKRIALGKDTHAQIDAALARRWVNIILRQYGALNIRTIDSLLHLVVRTAALEKELPPDFENTFRIQDMLEPIYEGLLERARDKDATILWMLRHVCASVSSGATFKGFGTGARIINNLMPLVECALMRELPAVSPAGEITEALEELQEERCAAARRLLAAMDALNEQHAAKTKGKTCFKSNVREVIELCACGGTSTSAYASKESFAECARVAYASTISEDMERDYAYMRDSVSDIFFLEKAVREAPFIQLAQRIADEVEEFQRKNTLVHGGTMARRAYDILAGEFGVPTALCRLGSQMRHILLDEFQDTSREQWRALLPLISEALSTGGSLTWVGDIKQAIYGWRGGDSDLFDGVLGESELRVMVSQPEQAQLPTNWRSRCAVVETNNALFAPLAQPEQAVGIVQALLSRKCPASVLGETVAKLSQAFQGTAQKVCDKYMEAGVAEGYYTMTEVIAPNAEELDVRVKEELQRLLMEDVAQRRPWGDVALLVRNNDQATLVASWLLEWGVPVITENSLLLAAHPLVRESIALLSFLSAPQDDVSFWTLVQGQMLSPYFAKAGVCAQELELWLASQRAQGVRVVSAAFRKAWPQVWGELFAPFFNTAGLMTPYNCLQEWYRLRHVATRFPDDSAFVRSLLECVHHADAQGHATLGTFLHHWEHIKDEAKAPMPNNPNAVCVMTIHKSKGLQFPVVIVPWLNFSMQDDKPYVPFHVCGFDVFIKRCKEMEEAFYTARAQVVLEAFNVFYVACTRAIDELHAFNTRAETVKSGNFALGLPLLLEAAGFEASFERGCAMKGTNAVVAADEASGTPTDTLTGGTHSGTLPNIPSGILGAAARPMQWLPSLKIYRSPLQDVMSTQDEQQTLSPRKRGLLLHHCLEIWHSIYSEQGHNNEQSEQDKHAHAVSHAVEYSLRTFTAAPLPTSQDALEEIAHQCTQCLHWYSTLPDVHTWAQYALPEQEILDSAGVVHRVDVLVSPHHGAGWRVIDYKTGKENQAYITQLERYMALLEALPMQKGLPPVEGMLVYLDSQQCRMLRTGAPPSALFEAPRWHCVAAF